MKRTLFYLVLAIALFACEKNDDTIKLRLSTESCVLNNETSYAEIQIERDEGFLSITSSDPDIARILYTDNENIFYIIGHSIGNATVTVNISNDVGSETTRIIDVRVSEPISYQFFAGEGIYIKKGESRVFELPFTFDKNYSVVADGSAAVDTEGAATFSASAETGSNFRVEGKTAGNILFHVLKGKVELYSVHVYVVDEYDLFVPPSDDRLTFKLPFSYGVNGISIWRGSGNYSARIIDETVAEVKSVTPGKDFFNSMNNSAVVRVTPLKAGITKLIVTDTITGQTNDIEIVVEE